MLTNLIALLVMLVGLALIPFGLAGLWLMVGVVVYGVLVGEIAWWVLTGVLMLGIVAELMEFFAVKRFSDRHGGSRAAFWGAIAGGLVGAVMVGGVLPIIGPFVGGVAGTFAGAALVTAYEVRHAGSALRVGMGAALGRAAAVAIKVAIAIVILVVGMTALVL